MQMFTEVIKHLWGKPWFHEVLLLLFFAIVFLRQQIIATERFLRWQIKRQPDNADAHFKLGMLLCEDDECYEESEMEFRRAISLNPQNIQAYYLLHAVQDSAKKVGDAEKTLAQITELFPDDALASCWKGMSLSNTDAIKAEEYFTKAISLAPRFATLYERYGHFLLTQERFEDAETIFIKAHEYDPFSSYTNQSLSYTYQNLIDVLFKSEKHHEAERYARKFLKFYPKNPDTYNALGHVLKELSRHDEAEFAYKKAIKLNHEHALAYSSLGALYEEQLRYAEAETMFLKAIEFDDADNLSRYHLAKVLRRLDRTDEAMDILITIAESTPDDYLIHLDLASIYKSQNDIVKAAHHIGIARSLIKENDPDYWYNLSCMESMLENTTPALNFLRKAKDENGLDTNWAWKDPDLQWIRGDPRFVEIVGSTPEK